MRRSARNKADLEWWHTSQIVAAIYNGAAARRDKRPWSAQDFHPFAKRVPINKMDAESLKSFRSMCRTHTVVKASEVKVK